MLHVSRAVMPSNMLLHAAGLKLLEHRGSNIVELTVPVPAYLAHSNL